MDFARADVLAFENQLWQKPVCCGGSCPHIVPDKDNPLCYRFICMLDNSVKNNSYIESAIALTFCN
jgi:hypothetical protein